MNYAPARSSAPPARWDGIVTHACLVGVLWLLASEEPWITLCVGGALSVVVFSYLTVLESRRAPLVVGPLTFLFFWNAMALGTSAIYMGSQLRTGKWISFSVAQVPPEHIAKGYAIVSLGVLAMHIGLAKIRPLYTPQARQPGVLSSRWLLFITVLAVLGVLFKVKYQWFVFLGALAKPLFWAPTTALVIFALADHSKLRYRELLFWITIIGGTIALIAINSYTGSKAYLMFSFIPFAWPLLLRPKHRKWIPVIGIAFLLTYTFFVAPAVMRARATPMLPGESAVEHMLRHYDASNVFSTDFFVLQTEALLERQFETISTAFIVGEVERNGFQAGDEMQYAKYALIPRFLWPDKPTVGRGAWFTVYLGFAPREAEAGTSTGITAPGELYWNFGLLGVVVGMFGIGCLYGLAWRMAGENPVASPLHMLLYVMITFAGMTELPEAVTVYAAVISELLVFGALFYLLRGPLPRRQVFRPVAPRTFQPVRSVEGR